MGKAAPTGYWLFEPTERASATAPVAGPLPLVIFFHGFGADDPALYHDWITHLTQRGAIVVYPDWQHATPSPGSITAPKEENLATDLGNAEAAVRAALTELARAGHSRPDLTQVPVLGHSYGAVLAARYAASASNVGLPVPKAVVLANPACNGCSVADLKSVPAPTRVLVLAGSDDHIAGADPSRVFAALTSVPPAQRNLITLQSDDHGQPPLVANHNVATTGTLRQPDALNWYGVWKWTDALMSCAFAGQECAVALGNTPQQRFMGTWSDGTPVAEPRVVTGTAAPAS